MVTAIPEPDRELAVRLTEGDETALARAYDLYSGRVYGLAARVTRDSCAAEDVTQEVFVHLWEHPTAFDPARGTLRGWLGTLAHRRAVDWVRREQTRRRWDLRAGHDVQPPADPEDHAIAGTFAIRVRSAVSSLPNEQRAAITLAYFEGMTYRQVAAALGIPEGTAKSRMRSGLQRLAERLHAEGITP